LRLFGAIRAIESMAPKGNIARPTFARTVPAVGLYLEVSLSRIRLLTRAVVAVLLLSATPAVAASFPSVVRAVLDAQTDGRLAKMGRDQRSRMSDCVIATLSGLPGGKKRYIVEGASLDQQQDRFGEVVQEDRAKWKQKIATACSKIAVESSSND
jgi:hypothetical protein